MKSLSKHLPHYISLIGILLVGVFGYVFFWYDYFLQVSIIVGIAISYVAWGIIHHFLHRDLHLSVVIEYILIASLGLTITLSLIAR